jgi:subfamily B ATP-binding cassette protein MsbA
MFLYALVSGFSLSLLSPFLHAIFYEQALVSSNDLLARLNDWFLQGSKIDAFIRLQVVIVIVFTMKGILGYLHQYLGASIEEKIMKRVRDETHSHLHLLSLGFFQQTMSGVLLSRVTNDVLMVKGAAKEGFLKFAQQLLLTLAYLSFALYISWRLLLVTLITFPVLAWLLDKLSKKLRERSDQVQEDMADITSALGESISGTKIIKAFSTQEFEIRKFVKLTHNYLKSALRFERIGVMGVPISELIVTFGMCILLSYGAYLIFGTHTLSPDRFLVFLACALSMMQSLKQLPKANVAMQKGIQAMVRVRKVLDTEPTVKETADPVGLSAFEREIVFDDIHFGYNDSQEVIRGISLTIRKGDSVAFVGPSGAGKSTLTDLLARFYDPTHGTIKVDGTDIKQVSLTDLRSLIGLVTQESFLFNDSVLRNIAYGMTEPSPESIERAAKLANAQEFIDKLPQGYDTVIGERGAFLSGGQRQRISIARALYRDPDILIFDEATSHLDPESESKIQQAVANLLKDRTAIVIAHRLSTVQDCGRIIVIDDGKIAEEGTHEELVRNDSLYQRLVSKELDR